MTSSPLSLRARMTYCAHLFKALTRQHHSALAPVLAPYIPQDGVVIDVGAHAGQFAKLFSRMVPQGHVYAFEPGSYALSILRKVHTLHRLRNVTIIPCGLGAQEEEATLNVPIKKSGSLGFGLSTLGKSDNTRAVHTNTVRLTTLDRFAQDNNLQRMDFIKADIEGWEMHMLRGARDCLERFKPSIMVEINEKALSGAGDSGQTLHAFLSGAGYDLVSQEHDCLFVHRSKRAA